MKKQKKAITPISKIYMESLYNKNPVTKPVYREIFINRLDRMEKEK